MNVSRRTLLQGAGGGAIALSIARFSGFEALAQSATPAAGTGPYPVQAYTAKEYAFAGPGSFNNGLNQVSLTNNGKMTHHAMFMLLHENKTIADLAAAAQKDGLGGLFSVSTSAGGPGSIDPGQTSTVVLDFKAGNYVVVCVIPDADGVPHMAKGMALPITVTAGPMTKIAPPTADVTVSLADFSFANLPDTVKAGKQIWQITNKGAQLHELGMFKLGDGFTLEALVAMVSAASPATPMPGMTMATPVAAPASSPAASGPPPVLENDGFAPVSPGGGGWLLLDLAAGNYAALCFVPDIKTGKPHFMLGMQKAFTAS